MKRQLTHMITSWPKAGAIMGTKIKTAMMNDITRAMLLPSY